MISILIFLYLLMVAGLFLYSIPKLRSKTISTDSWHLIVIDVSLLAIVCAFIISGLGVYFLKGNPGRDGQDWGLVIGFSPILIAMPLALLSLTAVILGWKIIDKIHKIRAFIPIFMYLIVFLASALKKMPSA